MPKYTPMIEQYLAIKSEVPDAILLFRLGDFYEMFFDDAKQASRELDITLTGREGGAEERIPMCGVPHHSADNYIYRLVDKGYKVAICEQVEDPAEAKGVVRREIVRIVTPGTLMEGKALQGAGNNFIVCVTEADDRYGLAACDLSTGELLVTTMERSDELLLDELYVFKPAELIGDEALITSVLHVMPASAKPLRSEPWSKSDETIYQNQFDDDVRSGLHASSAKAVSSLLAYLHTTQKRSLEHIRTLHMYQPQQYMILDPFTRRNLELTETVRDQSRSGTLLWLLDRTVTSMGARLLRRWIEKPLMNIEMIEERLEAVDVLGRNGIALGDLRTALKNIYDLERLVGRIAYGNANARDMLALKQSLEQVPEIVLSCMESGSVTLAALVAAIDPCGDIQSWIEHAIDDDAPVSVREGGMIKAGYHDRLDGFREAGKSGKQWMAELERSEREATGIKSLKLGYNKVFGYYIEVTKSNLHALPEGRYERKQTLANAERYVTPELKEKEALILEAEDRMVGLEYELFTELRERIALQITRLQKLASIIAHIDSLQSLAEVSASRDYRRPSLTDGFDLVIEAGRHPVVEAVLREERFVHNDAKLTSDQGSILLITGPNMAGKSTYMRQVALICIMAQIGCFVPAEYAQIPLIDRIFTRIGAADDLIGGQSTFMVEMMDIRVMTEKATASSLVIIDELGRGTSTNEGMAIAQAVIEFLHDHVGCKTLVSTHFHELAHLEEPLEQLWNGRMAVKETEGEVTFLRKLVPGAADTSYGIYCARIAGLPDSIIGRSYELLQVLEQGHKALLSESAAASAHGARQAVVQLSLFDPPSPKPTAPEPVKKQKLEPGIAKAVELLREADLLHMTPLQAMQFIHELQQLIPKQAMQ
jgi:DNA mismatch repair protein MutS